MSLRKWRVCVLLHYKGITNTTHGFIVARKSVNVIDLKSTKKVQNHYKMCCVDINKSECALYTESANLCKCFKPYALWIYWSDQLFLPTINIKIKPHLQCPLYAASLLMLAYIFGMRSQIKKMCHILTYRQKMCRNTNRSENSAGRCHIDYSGTWKCEKQSRIVCMDCAGVQLSAPT